mgnify:CR=1 FL=1
MARRKSKQKKSNFVDKPNKEFEVYKKGAFIGGLIGGITGLLIGKKIILGIVIGAVAGGYIAHSINEENSDMVSLKKFKDLK